MKKKLLRTKTSMRNAKRTNAHPVSLSRWLGSNLLIGVLAKMLNDKLMFISQVTEVDDETNKTRITCTYEGELHKVQVSKNADRSVTTTILIFPL